jgi:SNF2 family DNA or RNA helicase
MDELQFSFIGRGIFLWGVSSEPKEMFTPTIRLEIFHSSIYPSAKFIKKDCNIEMPAEQGVPIVPISMRLFYGQFDEKKPSLKKFRVSGLEISDFLTIRNILFTPINLKDGGDFRAGDSFEFFRLCLRFAYSLVARQRFLPYSRDGTSCYISNIDITEDYDLFRQLARKAPLSVRNEKTEEMETVAREIIDYFVNDIVMEAVRATIIKIKTETKTDRWLSGLIGGAGNVDREIEQGLAQWATARKSSYSPEYNMLFKLDEPAENRQEWLLSFNIQSRKDPSMIMELNELWRDPRRLPVKDLKVGLLKDLAIAAKCSRTVEGVLRGPIPHNVSLTNSEAFNFILGDTYLLKDAGFAVQIPKITQTKTNSFRVNVKFKDSGKFKIQGTGSMGLALFEFDYSVAMGDVELDHDEFMKLSESKEKLVRVKNKWVEVNPEEIKRVIRFFEKKKPMSLYDTFLLPSSEESNFEIGDVVFPDRLKDGFAGLFDAGKIEIMESTDGFEGSLRPYQKHGFSWMLYLRRLGFCGILADDMGLGKTIQAIAYFLSVRGSGPFLVICPMSVIGNWERELKRFSPSLKVYAHHGQKRLKTAEFENSVKGNDVVLTSYATIRIDQNVFERVSWDTVILDEAQNIKNPFAQQTMAMSRLKSQHRYCLTGTPIENRLSEFWSIMNFTNPGLLFSWKTFKKRYAMPIELGGDENRAAMLRRLIAPFIMRRLKSDKRIINELPTKTVIKEYCVLSEEQATLYQAVVNDSMKKIMSDDKDRRAQIMATLIKLKQVCNHPANYLKDSAKLGERSGKVGRLRELVEIILKNNEKCLIFTQYKEMGDMLKPDLEAVFGIPVCYLHGSLDRKAREQMISLFQSDEPDSPKIFILSLKAGGFGLNLTSANRVIHFDRWWNPAVENQATDRAFRIGQKKDVFVHKFITSGTIEEKIDEMIERKMNLSDMVLTKGEIAITEFTDTQLKELIELRTEY